MTNDEFGALSHRFSVTQTQRAIKSIKFHKMPSFTDLFVTRHSKNSSFPRLYPLIIDLIAFFSLQPMQDFNKAVFSFVLGENT